MKEAGETGNAIDVTSESLVDEKGNADPYERGKSGVKKAEKEGKAVNVMRKGVFKKSIVIYV